MEGGVMKEEGNRLAKEQRLRKAVYNAIITLSECIVETTTLQRTLNNLDQSSWMEVVEERYLGRMCGFPLCTNPVQVKNAQKYRIDLKNKKVFERSAEIDKFCCRSCFLRSAAVRAQLEAEPLWIRGDEQVKIFDLNAENVRQQQQDTYDVEFVEDQQLITSLEILKICFSSLRCRNSFALMLTQHFFIQIGDTAESDDEDNDDETNMDEEKKDDAHKEFYNLCQSYLTMKSAVASIDEIANDPTVKRITDETVTKMEIEAERKDNKRLSESEKLARIRSKYSQNKFKRPPEIIEAKPFNSELCDKVPENLYQDFKRILSEWCGPETICHLQLHRRMNLSDSENKTVTEAKSIIAQFYAGDRSINKIVEDVFLPPVDNVDQAKQRISVLVELLKPSWRLLERTLNRNGCGQQALEIISTFRLSATNVILEKKMCDLAVAVIFRLLAYCDRSLMDFYPSDHIVSSKFMKYLEQIRCDAKCYFGILSIITNKLE